MLKNVKNLVVVVLLAVSGIANAQITIKETPVEVGYSKTGTIKVISVELGGGQYRFLFKDRQYNYISDWKSFTVSNAQTLKDFGSILEQQLNTPKGTELRLDIDDTSILIMTRKMMGMTYLSVLVSSKSGPTGYFNIEKKNLDTLFKNI